MPTHAPPPLTLRPFFPLLAAQTADSRHDHPGPRRLPGEGHGTAPVQRGRQVRRLNASRTTVVTAANGIAKTRPAIARSGVASDLIVA